MMLLRRGWRCLRLVRTYFVDMVRSNIEVARIVAMSEPPEPAVIALRLDTRRPWVVSALANMITLTPGTLTLEVAPDASRLYVHVLPTRPIAEHRAHLANLQRRLLEVVT